MLAMYCTLGVSQAHAVPLLLFRKPTREARLCMLLQDEFYGGGESEKGSGYAGCVQHSLVSLRKGKSSMLEASDATAS